jgi:hypothetical protein
MFLKPIRQNVGFDVLTAVVKKSPVFWNITPCRSLKVNRRFGGTCRLHVQGKTISKARNQHEALLTCFMLVSCLAYCSTLKMEATCSSKMSVACNGLHGVRTLRYDSNFQKLVCACVIELQIRFGVEILLMWVSRQTDSYPTYKIDTSWLNSKTNTQTSTQFYLEYLKAVS